MDSNRFDQLTRAVATRRRGIAMLVGALLAGGAASPTHARPNRAICQGQRQCGGECCRKGFKCFLGKCQRELDWGGSCAARFSSCSSNDACCEGVCRFSKCQGNLTCSADNDCRDYEADAGGRAVGCREGICCILANGTGSFACPGRHGRDESTGCCWFTGGSTIF